MGVATAAARPSARATVGKGTYVERMVTTPVTIPAETPDRSGCDCARTDRYAPPLHVAEAEVAKDASERMDTDYDPVHITPGRDGTPDRDDGRLTVEDVTVEDVVDKKNGAAAAAAGGVIIILAPGARPFHFPWGGTDRSDQSDATHERHDIDFRDDFYQDHRTEPGVTYEQYQPAYHYGNELAWAQQLGGFSDWDQIKAPARGGWDEDRYGPWERFAAAVHFAWDRGKTGVAAVRT
jgi:hypothetical protein